MIEAVLCLVVAVSDGDTIKARCGEAGKYEQVAVRLAEIDAPEKGQPFGQRSKESLSRLCYMRPAAINSLGGDRYGRTVARVTCQGVDASLEQVRAGMAWAFTKYLTDAEIKQAESTARAASVGLWSQAAPMEPWAWRQRQRSGK